MYVISPKTVSLLGGASHNSRTALIMFYFPARVPCIKSESKGGKHCVSVSIYEVETEKNLDFEYLNIAVMIIVALANHSEFEMSCMP